MHLAKNRFDPTLFGYVADIRAWMSPFAAVGALIRVYGRRTACARKELFWEVPVYFIETEYDLSPGLAVLNDISSFLNARSAFWTRNIKTVLHSIIIQDRGPMFRYYSTDKCFVINPLKIPKLPSGARAVLFSTNMIKVLSGALIRHGRYGYWAVEHRKLLSERVAARFLLKSASADEDYFKVLTKTYQNIDQLRPGRYYYDRFKQSELGVRLQRLREDVNI